jgi:hypothetical protein
MSVFLTNDGIPLDELRNCKTALFVINGNTSEKLNFITPLMYSQLLDMLCDYSVR